MKKMLPYIMITSSILLSGMNALFSQNFEGYTVGLNIGYPIYSQDYFTTEATGSDATGPTIGIVVDTPFGFDLGPYAIGVGGGIDLANVGGDADYTGLYLTLNSIVYETPMGPLSLSAGGGYYLGGDLFPSSVGINGGIAIAYAVHDQPIVIQPYAKGTLILNVDGEGNQQGWLCIGATIHYDISTLF